MTESIYRISNYNDQVTAFRTVKEMRNLSNLALDEIAGLAAGHTSKVLGPNPVRGIGPVTFETYLNVLAVDLLMIANPHKLTEMLPLYEMRARAHVRSTPLIERNAIKRLMKELGRKGGLIGGPARAAALSPKRRKEIGRNAIKTRWERQRKAGYLTAQVRA